MQPLEKPRDRYVCVAMHDVSPATWPACRVLLDALGRVARVPVTLLLVPAYHVGRSARGDAAFAARMRERLTRGDELALHGYHHRDDQPVDGLKDFLLRRLYTAGEGEFAALPAPEARRRLAAGVQWFQEQNWPLDGFVPPAWLMGEGAWEVLPSFPLRYTTTLREMVLLPEGTRHSVPSLTYSTRSPWRRLSSRLWNSALLHHLRDAPAIRLGLHPADAWYPDVIVHWQHLLEKALEDRVALTKAELAEHLRGNRAGIDDSQGWPPHRKAA